MYDKKTFETTDMDFINIESSDFEQRDLIYQDTQRSIKPLTRIIIENPVLSNLLFQMLLFYNFFYLFLQFFILLTMMFYKLWIFDYQNYRDYIAYGCIIVYFPLELCSCYFGYLGNINERVSSGLKSSFIVPRANCIFNIHCILQDSMNPWNLYTEIHISSRILSILCNRILPCIRIFYGIDNHSKDNQDSNSPFLPQKCSFGR